MSEEPYVVEFYVAGVRFHQFHTVKNIMEEGDTVDLIPEPSNKCDKNAVKIKFNNIMLGYVPKRISAEVTDRILDLKATAIRLQPDFEPWSAIKVRIEEVCV